MKTPPEQILWKYLRARLPRIITQLSRDPDSPTFGSWDRNFWHYKMRDFSSMILQQGMLVVNATANYDAENNPFFQHPLSNKWIDASLDFWADQQLKNGSFNEYYPFEAGYPPTAFSLYAAGVIFKSREYRPHEDKVTRAVQKAINWLLKHPEKEALNQEAAGLAGIVLCSSLPGISFNKLELEKRLNLFYASQSEEGWFPEYGGPDTGYLSVTIDCLWEIYEATKDERAYRAMEKAIDYIGTMISVSSETPVMINSRNTDYLVIYGMTRMASTGNGTANAIVNRVIARLESPDHFLDGIDDRYAVHYVFSSFFRSLSYLKTLPDKDLKLNSEGNYFRYFTDAGILVSHAAGKSSVYVNLRKGGIVNTFTIKGIHECDYGWRIRVSEKKTAVSHWQNPSYLVEAVDDHSYSVSGTMTLHGWMVPSPVKHIGLRAISLVFGNRLIPFLKKMMILNEKETGTTFIRKIRFEKERLLIEDSISAADPEKMNLYRAPHYSLRHVSSAGQFVPEEMLELPHDEGKEENGRLVFKREFIFERNEE